MSETLIISLSLKVSYLLFIQAACLSYIYFRIKQSNEDEFSPAVGIHLAPAVMMASLLGAATLATALVDYFKFTR